MQTDLTWRGTTWNGKLGRRRMLGTWAALLAGGAGLSSLTACAAEALQADQPPAMPPVFKPDVPWFLTGQQAGGPQAAVPAMAVPPMAAPQGAAPQLAAPQLAAPEVGASPSGAAGLPPFVRPRAAWQAAPPVQPYVPHTPKGVSFHHTGAVWTGRPGPEQYLRNIQTFHTGPEREWEDIAYHFLVDLDGNVWEGRPATVRGNPSIYYDPTGLVLISYLGDFTAQTVTEPQIDAGVKTAAWLIRQYNIPPSAPITGHRDHAPTSCPGDHIYKLIQDGTIARRVQETLKA